MIHPFPGKHFSAENRPQLPQKEAAFFPGLFFAVSFREGTYHISVNGWFMYCARAVIIPVIVK